MPGLLMDEIREDDRPRASSLIHFLRITFEELYSGCTRNLAVNRFLVCDVCNGKGSQNVMPNYVACEQCDANNNECDLCSGSGIAISHDDRCLTCQGRKVVSNAYLMRVIISPGMRHGQKIIYKQYGTQKPNHRVGDIIVVLKQQEHRAFRRRGNDLLMVMDLDHNEANFGFEKVICTLDNRQLTIRVPEGQITQNDSLRCIPGEGMPVYRHPNQKGRLIIKFRVIEPAEAVDAMMAGLGL